MKQRVMITSERGLGLKLKKVCLDVPAIARVKVVLWKPTKIEGKIFFCLPDTQTEYTVPQIVSNEMFDNYYICKIQTIMDDTNHIRIDCIEKR